MLWCCCQQTIAGTRAFPGSAYYTDRWTCLHFALPHIGRRLHCGRWTRRCARATLAALGGDNNMEKPVIMKAGEWPPTNWPNIWWWEHFISCKSRELNIELSMASISYEPWYKSIHPCPWNAGFLSWPWWFLKLIKLKGQKVILDISLVEIDSWDTTKLLGLWTMVIECKGMWIR